MNRNIDEDVQKLERKLHITNLSEHNLENMDKLENSIMVSQKGKSTEKEILKGSISYDAYTQKALDYQKKTMGVPSVKQAKASGMVFVNSYTRSDGTEVKSYYRARKG